MMNSPAAVHWSVPSELLTPTPRAVQRKGKRIGRIAVSLFLVPHTLIGIGIIVVCILNPIVIFGTPARQAVVQRVYSSHSSKGGTSYFVQYMYMMDGAERVSTDQLYRKETKQFHAHDKIAVHAVRIGSKYYGMRELSVSRYMAHDAPLWFAAVFWNGIVSLFWLFFWGPVRLARSLVRSGTPAAGTVTGKRISRGKSNTPIVKYTFCPRESPNQPLTRELQVSREAWEAACEGQVITVLYQPDNPKRNVAYEFCDYVAVAI